MKGWHVIAILALMAIAAPLQADYAVGADLSFLQHSEDRGVVFKDGGIAKPGLSIFRDNGYNWVRLRLFHKPEKLPNNLDHTILLARKARRAGFRFLLNLHYSDTWADPKNQTPPAAWKDLAYPQLVEAVREYTRDVIIALRKAGAMPDMVQIGNEITPGMLWPHGRLPDKREQFADLLKAGIRGVEEGRADEDMPRIMIHIDKGGDKGATKWFFDNLVSLGVPFDVIGQSFYPWWHGSLDDLAENMRFMANTYRKDIILVEVAYCWRPTEYREKPGPFPETPDGQREFLAAVDRIVRATPHGRGVGVFWWEPAVDGHLRNRGFFDDDGDALPVMRVFSGK